jgi:hypothetical protein
MVCAAGNRVEDNAGANDMPTALGNRFIHAYANPTTDDWLKWAADEGNIHPLVIGYVRQMKDDLREFNSDVANRSEKAFASPRTWESVSRFIWAGSYEFGHEIFSKRIMGTVGRGVATKFLGYLRNSSACVSPDEIVRNPKKATVPTRQNLDALHATVASLEHHLRQNPKDWKACLTYSLRKEMSSEVGVLLASTIAATVYALPKDERNAAISDDLFAELTDRYEDLFDTV